MNLLKTVVENSRDNSKIMKPILIGVLNNNGECVNQLCYMCTIWSQCMELYQCIIANHQQINQCRYQLVLKLYIELYGKDSDLMEVLL